MSAANKHSACHKSRMASFNFRIGASFMCGKISRRSIKGQGQRSREGARDNHSHSPHNLQLFQLAEKKHTHTHTHTQRRRSQSLLRKSKLALVFGCVGLALVPLVFSGASSFLLSTGRLHSKCCVKQLGDAGCWLRLNSSCSTPFIPRTLQAFPLQFWQLNKRAIGNYEWSKLFNNNNKRNDEKTERTMRVHVE